MHLKVLHGIDFFYGCRNMINPRFGGATLWELGFTHKSRVHLAEFELKIGPNAEAMIWTGLHTSKFYLRASPKRQQLQKGCVVHNFPLFFQLCDITVARRQRRNEKRWNDVDGLALKLNFCTHSVCIARLMPLTLGSGPTMAMVRCLIDRGAGPIWIYNSVVQPTSVS